MVSRNIYTGKVKYNVRYRLMKGEGNSYSGIVKYRRRVGVMTYVFSPVIVLFGQVHFFTHQRAVHEFTGSFDPITRTLRFGEAEELSHTGKRIWCKVSDVQLTGNEELNRFKGSYQGCAGAWGVHPHLAGGPVKFKRKGSVKMEKYDTRLKELLHPPIHLDHWQVLGGSRQDTIPADAKVTLHSAITNTGNIAAEVHTIAYLASTVPGLAMTSGAGSRSGPAPTVQPGANMPWTVGLTSTNSLANGSVVVVCELINAKTGTVLQTDSIKLHTLGIAPDKLSVKSASDSWNTVKGIFMRQDRSGMEAIRRRLTEQSSTDPLAKGWLAYFSSTGDYNYSMDRVKAGRLFGSCINQLRRACEHGDAEAAFLLGAYLELTDAKGENRNVAEELLTRAARAGFVPAVIDPMAMRMRLTTPEQLGELQAQGYTEALRPWMEHDPTGVWPADAALTCKTCHDLNAVRDTSSATDAWFRYTDTAFAQGVNEAYLGMHANEALRERLRGEGREEELLARLQRGADAGGVRSMRAFARTCINRGEVDRGVAYLQRAALLHNAEAMKDLETVMGYENVDGAGWAAQRYWQNQAARLGVGKSEDDGVALEPLMNMPSELDLSPSTHVTVTNGYGTVVEEYDEGPGLLDIAFRFLGQKIVDDATQKQELRNEVARVIAVDGHEVYGGAMCSTLHTGIEVRPGDSLFVHANGLIETGMATGTRTPAGERLVKHGLGSDLERLAMPITADCPFGSLMLRVGAGTRHCAGASLDLVVKEAGEVIMEFNDQKFIGNKGYFNVELSVVRKP